MLSFTIAFIIFLSLITFWHWQKRTHLARIQNIPYRIHVNGIRGKSTVTRLIAGMLREAGYETIAKTTGSAARVIHEDGTESPINRLGAPTIVEQMRIIAQHTTEDTEALVIECMAVNPLYQNITQHQIVQGNITVITNVREDHQDVMGESLLEIADSLSNTIPEGGLLITAEDRPELVERLRFNALANNSYFLQAKGDIVPDEAVADFDYLTFKENIAIGLKIARLLKIPEDVAIRGMQKSKPDIGAVHVKRRYVHGKELIWAPLFAVNDRESTIASVDALQKYHRRDAIRIGILNNRLDRAARALQFADIAAQDLQLDYFITFGAYESQVTERMVGLGYPKERILNLGDSQNPSRDEILTAVTNLIAGQQGVLIGMVNIHTEQAELLM
ncbi:MAG: poly-gamma-glutamate synthase PgsB, partial [Chloroflexota bacterium]